MLETLLFITALASAVSFLYNVFHAVRIVRERYHNTDFVEEHSSNWFKRYRFLRAMQILFTLPFIGAIALPLSIPYFVFCFTWHLATGEVFGE